MSREDRDRPPPPPARLDALDRNVGAVVAEFADAGSLAALDATNRALRSLVRDALEGGAPPRAARGVVADRGHAHRALAPRGLRVLRNLPLPAGHRVLEVAASPDGLAIGCLATPERARGGDVLAVLRWTRGPGGRLAWRSEATALRVSKIADEGGAPRHRLAVGSDGSVYVAAGTEKRTAPQLWPYVWGPGRPKFEPLGEPLAPHLWLMGATPGGFALARRSAVHENAHEVLYAEWGSMGDPDAWTDLFPREVVRFLDERPLCEVDPTGEWISLPLSATLYARDPAAAAGPVGGFSFGANNPLPPPAPDPLLVMVSLRTRARVPVANALQTYQQLANDHGVAPVRTHDGAWRIYGTAGRVLERGADGRFAILAPAPHAQAAARGTAVGSGHLFSSTLGALVACDARGRLVGAGDAAFNARRLRVAVAPLADGTFALPMDDSLLHCSIE